MIASGNNGFIDGISSPACISTAISVGATDKSDVVAGYSNSASFLDLLAPGSAINSSVPGGGFATWNGTSMATPHVAGAWAVIKSQQLNASVDDVLNALVNTAVPILDGRNGITKPRIDVEASLNDDPSITIIEPDGIGDTADSSFTITWTDDDPEENASISLYYDIDNTGQDGVLEPVQDLNKNSNMERHK